MTMRMTKGLYTGAFMLLAVLLATGAFAQAAAPAAPGAAAPAAPAAPAAAAPAAPAAPPAAAAVPPAPPLDKAKASYAIGVQVAYPAKNIVDIIDREQFLKGVNDVFDNKVAMTEEELMAQLRAFQPVAKAKIQENMKKAADENTAEEQKFLAENGKKEGVVTLPSGLQYKVVKEGTGAIPTATDRVQVNYSGKFADGKEFDNSLLHDGQKGVPLPVNGVIPAWKEALQLMKVGSKWELYVPSALGYGVRGQGSKIPPAKLLVFEMELLEILPPAPAPEAAPGSLTIPPAAGGQAPANAAPANPAPASAAKGSS